MSTVAFPELTSADASSISFQGQQVELSLTVGTMVMCSILGPMIRPKWRRRTLMHDICPLVFVSSPY